ncbi:MAG: cyanophycin synthetase [Bacillota bacterium]|nr:cyanophycin synthetase [Bacillota bacterium]MDW7683041.1 cyanophycin synthetase [Bacillota bacterium]
MNIVDLFFYPGRNIYSHRPVMKMLLDLACRKSVRTDQVPGFSTQLLGMLPGLWNHHCSRRRPGGFVERLREGTYLGHVVEHVFLELQNMAEIGTDYGKTRMNSDGLVEIICEYRCRDAAKLLAASAVSVVSAALGGNALDLNGVLTEAKKAAANELPGPSTAAILSAARRNSIPVQLLEEGTSLYRLGTGKYQKRIMASISDETGCIATDIACSKPLTKKILAELGLPVPCGEVVRSSRDALVAAHKLGFPVAIKPDNGNQGKGVSLNIMTAVDVKKGFLQASAYSPSVIVEAYLPGRHYRLLVVDRKFVAAAERIPAHVVGDGYLTVEELIAKENRNPLRGEGHENVLTKICIDEITRDVLRKQDVSLTYIPGPEETVWLRDNANLSTGGIARDVTDEIHPRQAEMAVMAVKAVGLDIGGVDMIMQDIALPPEGQEGGIIEVNAAPGLRMHLHPTEGKKRDVAKKIVDMLFPPGTPSRVPLFSVTGTNGKTTTTRMLEYIMRQHGLVTGMCCTDGIYISGNQVQRGDMTGPGGARSVLANPDIEVAVLETARGGIIRRGLGYDRADVAIICNVRPDHLGQDGIETMDDLVHVKSLVAEAVYPSGTVVLNADELHVNDIAGRVWTDIIFISRQGENIRVRRHLGKGGRALFVRRGMILAAIGSRVTPVARVSDFACTFNGRAGHQVENILCALAACWGYGLLPQTAGRYLRNFGATVADNPGRANLYQTHGVHVLVDYGHNPDGIAKTGELANKLKKGRSICVVGVPGDRCDELVMMAGNAAGRAFDLLIIKEDRDLRGRAEGEVARLLLKGALAAGKEMDNIVVQADEQLAVKKAFSMAKPGDLVVIFYEKLEAVLPEICAGQNQESLPADAQKAVT